jgi:hypothetical protein
MEPLSHDKLSLEYYGETVKGGNLKAKDVGRYILALDDFMSVVTKEAYGKEAVLNMDVTGFRGQSFDVDFALTVVGLTNSAIFCASSPKDLITLATDTIKACIHLAGKPPTNIIPDRDNNTVNIENSNGTTQIFNIQTVNLLTDPKAVNSLDTFIRDPLSKGLEAVKLKSSQFDIQTEALAKDVDSFKPLEYEIPVSNNTITTGLTIESPSFKEGNKWYFSDGQTSFYAEITDDIFLDGVDKGERFGKGDLLHVIMDIIQTKSLTGLKIEKIITKVTNHQEAPKQYGMFN